MTHQDNKQEPRVKSILNKHDFCIILESDKVILSKSKMFVSNKTAQRESAPSGPSNRHGQFCIDASEVRASGPLH